MAMLEGIRIVDLTTVIFGPYATQMLADLGADVIKIESGIGDPPRYMGKGRNDPMMSGTHLTVNRGKRSIMLDLKQEDDANVLRKLIETADIFVHNVRAKAIDRLGFGYDAIKAIKPDIIYAHFAGFDQAGPFADAPAYDDVIQAASGTTSLLSRADGDPRPRFFPSLVADKVSGTYGAQSLLAALVHKLRTGEGQKLEVPMLECFTAFTMTEHLQDMVYEPPIGPPGYPRQLDPARQPFPTKDGHVVIVPYTDAKILTLFEALGDPDFCAREPFDTPGGRFKHMTDIYARIGELTQAFSTSDLVDLMTRLDFPVMPATDLADVPNHPALVASDFFRLRDHPVEGLYREMRPPVKYGAWQGRDIRFAPTLGQHNEEIRKELGLPPRTAAE